MTGARAFDKEENLYFLIERLLASYAQPSGGPSPQGGREIQAACAYMERHYTENIALEDLARVSGRGKFALLRAFTVEKGITPYQYLSTIRINHAKSLMEAGTAPIDAAMQTGFADQSHFTRFFKTFIGLTPGAYRDLFQGEAK
jgi:transcriptional regulator GlxA family with amidase domain